MTGAYQIIIAREIDAFIESTLNSMPLPYHIAKDDIRVSATWVDVDIESGRCQRIGRLTLGSTDLEAYAAKLAPGAVR